MRVWRREHRRFLAYLIVVVAFVGGLYRQEAAIKDNCGKIHRVVTTLDTIIASGTEQIDRYVSEGTLTREQGDRALNEQDKARKKLTAGADCGR